MSEKERLKMDDLMLLHFQSFNFEGVRSVLTYWPMEHLAEPNPLSFAAFLKLWVYGIKVAYPVCDFERGSMRAVQVDDDTIYTVTPQGITQPNGGMELDPEEIDLVLMPNLIYDKEGYRVGYGKGFYDKFLKNCSEEATFIGLNYFPPVDSIDDVTLDDVQMHYCITPDDIFEFDR